MINSEIVKKAMVDFLKPKSTDIRTNITKTKSEIDVVVVAVDRDVWRAKYFVAFKHLTEDKYDLHSYIFETSFNATLKYYIDDYFINKKEPHPSMQSAIVGTFESVEELNALMDKALQKNAASGYPIILTHDSKKY